MSYPKCCEKCEQFGDWCFCEPSVSPMDFFMHIAWSEKEYYYFAQHGGVKIRLCGTQDIVHYLAKLYGEASSRATDGVGRLIKYTPEKWAKLLELGNVCV